MKKIINYSIALVVLLLGVSCDKNFEDINTNRTSPTAIDPVFQLNNAVVNLSFPFSVTVVYDQTIVQQMVSPNSGVLAGGNFNVDNRPNTQQLWQNYYRNVIRNTQDVIVKTTGTDRGNLTNMARILQTYAFMVLTDAYGDIPYTEGGLGYIDQKFLPKYDKQSDIYPKIIQELTDATGALNAANKTEAGEVLYGGNIAQWKKFGYSLLLRAGMRLSKADAAKAQAAVTAAFNAGVITANADNAVIRHDANYQFGIGNTLNGTEAANFYLAKPFVDQLKSTNDPRLQAIAVRYNGAKSGPEQTPAVATTAPASQNGMPMGYDNATIGPIATGQGLASFYEYSQADRRRVTKTTSPCFLVTAGQTNLLLAEARQRGWITAGTVQAYYEAGITAHMQQMASYDAGSAIAAGDITTYITNNPFNAAQALQQINTQYWIASFLNGPEAFANFRRSGFPTLTPNPYPGKEITGTFIRRITYPNSEISVNGTNLAAAVASQGPDNLDTKVWWDKP